MQKSGKIWGWTTPILQVNGVQIERIHINKGGYCSVHKHEFRFNAFYIISGTLEVSVWKNDYELCDKTVLSQNDITIVKPHEYHRFLAKSDVEALEIYWTEDASSNDIIRKLCGGTTTGEPPEWLK